MKFIVDIDSGNGGEDKPVRKKGTSLTTFPSDYCVLDLETTGFNPTYDRIIEIGILKVRNNETIDSYQTLVNPEEELDPFITELTGITDEMLENAPLFDAVYQDVLSFIGNDIIVGHNVHFDINFLYDNFIAYDHTFDNDLFDLLRISRRVLQDLNHHRLKDLAQFFDYEYKAHRAITDCVATNDIKNLLHRHIIDNGIDYESLFAKSAKGWRLDLSQIEPTTEINEDNYFFNKQICFTGKLESFTRAEAAQIAVNLGATAQNNVTKKTNCLVIGSFDYGSTVKDNKSSKIKKAEKLMLEGQDIIILDEKTFLDLIES